MDFKMPFRPEDSNKGTFGKVLNIAGAPNYNGAAYLSSVSALKVGCGYVTLAACPSVLASVAALTPDVVFVPVGQVKSELSKYDVISLGCGFSTDAAAVLIFKSLMNEIAELETPVVIDADGLNILSKFKNLELPQKLILTPHPKEASKLLKTDINEVLNSPEESARAITEKYHCTTVLKGHRTVVCSVKSNIYINTTGNSALAKAGSGDVLCGMISGLVAQGMKPFEATKTAVYLHGLAGEIAANELTEYSVLASELIKYIPKAIKTII